MHLSAGIRRRITSLREHSAGAAIQAANAAATASQAFLGPRLLGAVEYGQSQRVLTFPFLIQALMETVLFSLAIKYEKANERAKISRLYRDALVIAAVGALLTLTYYALLGDTLPRFGTMLVAILVLLIWTPSTIAMSAAYAIDAHSAVAYGYCASAVVLGVGISVLHSLGSLGFVLALLANQVVFLFVVTRTRAVRSYLRAIMHVAPESGPRWRRTYAPVVVSRLALLLFSVGLMLLGAVLLDAQSLATLKVSLTLAAAVAYLIPVSTPVLMSRWARMYHESPRLLPRSVFSWLSLIFIAGGVFGALLWIWGADARQIILRSSLPMHQYDVIFLAIPAFLLIGPISALLITVDMVGLLVRSFLISAVAVMVASFSGLQWSFVAGTIAFNAIALIAYGMNQRRAVIAAR